MIKNMSEFHRLRRSLIYAWHGLRAAYKHQVAFRVEVSMFIVGSGVALVFTTGIYDRLWLMTSLLLILFAELLNTAIEMVVDRISLEKHALSKRAKDLGSAAVFTTILYAGLVWGMIFLPKIYTFLAHY